MRPTGAPRARGPRRRPARRVPAAAARSQTTAAVSGIITASLALVIIASMLTFQLVYRDYYACVDDALTKDGLVACNELLPEPLRDYMGVPEE